MESKFLMLLLWQGSDQNFSISNKSLSISAVTKIYFMERFREESNKLLTFWIQGRTPLLVQFWFSFFSGC